MSTNTHTHSTCLLLWKRWRGSVLWQDESWHPKSLTSRVPTSLRLALWERRGNGSSGAKNFSYRDSDMAGCTWHRNRGKCSRSTFSTNTVSPPPITKFKKKLLMFINSWCTHVHGWDNNWFYCGCWQKHSQKVDYCDCSFEITEYLHMTYSPMLVSWFILKCLSLSLWLYTWLTHWIPH